MTDNFDPTVNCVVEPHASPRIDVDALPPPDVTVHTVKKEFPPPPEPPVPPPPAPPCSGDGNVLAAFGGGLVIGVLICYAFSSSTTD